MSPRALKFEVVFFLFLSYERLYYIQNYIQTSYVIYARLPELKGQV